MPAITVITPVYEAGKPVFYVASRRHHADIGGISPGRHMFILIFIFVKKSRLKKTKKKKKGSMPPFSHTLDDEGACIKSFKLVVNGVFQEQGITEVIN